MVPFFLGAVAGGIASGRVPATGHGDPLTSWLNPTSVLGGVLAILVVAFVAAVFLAGEARRQDELPLEVWFRRRAQLTALPTGFIALAGIAVRHADSPRLFRLLLTRGLPLVVVSGLSGLAALALIRRAAPRVIQGLAVLAAAAIVTGWGTAQYPYVLGTHLSISAAAAPQPTLVSLTVVAALALLLVVPSMGLLFVLAQRGVLEGH